MLWPQRYDSLSFSPEALQILRRMSASFTFLQSKGEKDGKSPYCTPLRPLMVKIVCRNSARCGESNKHSFWSFFKSSSSAYLTIMQTVVSIKISWQKLFSDLSLSSSIRLIGLNLVTRLAILKFHDSGSMKVDRDKLISNLPRCIGSVYNIVTFKAERSASFGYVFFI